MFVVNQEDKNNIEPYLLVARIENTFFVTNPDFIN